MNGFRNFLLKNNITPKWVIFLLDLSIAVICFIYANYLLTDFQLISLHITDLIWAVAIVAAINSLFFLFFKTYEGIIRLSEFQEALRSVSAVFCTFFVLIIMNIFLKVINVNSFLANSALIVYFFSASFIISGYRIMVRKLYEASIERAESINIIIYGAETDGHYLQRTLEKISLSKYKVVAFLDDREEYIGKAVEGIKVFSYKDLKSLISPPYNVRALFFAGNKIDVSIKNMVVDECLEHKVKVMNMPAAKDWAQSKFGISQFREVKIDELLGRPAIQISNPEVVSFLAGKRVLITGAAGSIGSELAHQVAAINPASLIVCDQLETGLYELEYQLQKDYNLHSDVVKIFLADVKDDLAMESLFDKYRPEIVFHAAAYKHVPMMENHPSEAIRNNVLGTKIVADLSVKYDVERFLFVSTDKAINPTNIMGASKRIAEMYCHGLQKNDTPRTHNNSVVKMLKKQTKFVTTRFGNVLASNGSVIPRFREQIESGGPVTVTHPDIIRYFMTIPEACSLVLEAVTMGNGGEIFLFDMGEPVKILDLARKMIRLAGYEPGEEIKIIFSGLRPGEKLYEELLNKQEQVIPTHHNKILIAKTGNTDYTQLLAEIEDLLAVAANYNDEDVVRKMKTIVPEFISNNPVYNLYDMAAPSVASLS